MEDGAKPLATQSGGWRAPLVATRAWLERYALFRILKSTAQGFSRDQVFSHAAALTYYGIFSLFPIILLTMAALGLALQSSAAAREQVLELVAVLLPQGQETLRKVIAGVVETRGTAAGVGILALLWSVLVWFQELDQTINQIWGVGKPRSLVKTVILALSMAAGVGAVVISSFAASAAIALLARATGGVPGSVGLWQGAVSLLSILALAGVLFLLYRYTPQRRVQFADIWPAALAMAVAWEATRRLLAFYLQQFDLISGYGPVGAAMALLLWLYAASTVTLAGAELSYAIAKERRHITPERELAVIAPLGEQPTPKFAPQVGRGFTTPIDEDEPIRAAPPRDTNALGACPYGAPRAPL